MRARRLSALPLASAALVLLAAPVSAVERGPASRDEGVHVPGLSCSGDTLHVTAVVRGVRDLGPVTLALSGRDASGAWSSAKRSVTVPAGKPGRSSWSMNIAGLPAGLTGFRVAISAAGRTVQTPVVESASCAPGTEVPEVPAGPLVPLTLAATASVLLAVRSRSQARAE